MSRDRESLTDEERLEFQTVEAMMRALFANRGRGDPMTKVQALELATLVNATINAAHANGLSFGKLTEGLVQHERGRGRHRPASGLGSRRDLEAQPRRAAAKRWC